MNFELLKFATAPQSIHSLGSNYGSIRHTCFTFPASAVTRSEMLSTFLESMECPEMPFMATASRSQARILSRSEWLLQRRQLFFPGKKMMCCFLTTCRSLTVDAVISESDECWSR